MSEFIDNTAGRKRRQDRIRHGFGRIIAGKLCPGEFNEDELLIIKAFNLRNARCGRWWLMHHYFTEWGVKHLPVDGRCCGAACACESCAARRQAKLGRKITKKILKALSVEGRTGYFLTLTIRTGPDLKEQFTLLEESIAFLFAKARMYRHRPLRQPYTVFAEFISAICAIEIKESKGLWHVHAHLIVITSKPVQEIVGVADAKAAAAQFKEAIRAEWFSLTNAHQIQFERLRSYDRFEAGEIDSLMDKDKGLPKDVAELVKYPTKFSCMSVENLARLLVFLRGGTDGRKRRILRYYGRRDVLSIEEPDLADFEDELAEEKGCAYDVYRAEYVEEGLGLGGYQQQFLYHVGLDGMATLEDGYRMPLEQVQKFFQRKAPVKLAPALRAVKAATRASGEWSEANESTGLAEERSLLSARRQRKRLPSYDSGKEDSGFYGTEEGIALMNRACLPMAERYET